VTLAVPCLGGEVVTVERSSPLVQGTDLARYGPFPSTTITNLLDKLTMMAQEASAALAKTMRAARSNLAKFSSLELPDPQDGSMVAFLADAANPGKFKFQTALSASKEYVDSVIQAVLGGGSVVAPTSWVIIGDGVNTDYPVAGAPFAAPDLYLAYIDGVPQEPITSYTMDITVVPAKIKFTEVVPLNARIFVRVLGYAKGVNIGDTSLVVAAGGTTARTLAARALDFYNVKDFGAIGDGVADDTLALNRTRDAIPLKRGTMRLPRGTYKSTAFLMFPKLTLQGDGVEVTTIQQSGVGSLFTSDVSGQNFSGLHRMTVRGDGTAGQKLLNMAHVYAAYFSEVFMSSADNLCELTEIEGQTMFRDCYFTAAGIAGYCLRLNNVQDLTIFNSPFENSAAGVYATRFNAVTRLKFEKIHSENVGQLFNIDTGTNNGIVSFKDIVTFGTGAIIADPTLGYAFRVNNEFAFFENCHVQVVNALTPVITTPLWSIFAKDCPSFTGADDLTAYIPRFEIGFGSAYISNAKRSILDATEALATLYTVTGGAAVSVAGGFGAFTGSGQYRIRPLTGPAISPTLIANKAIMVRFEYRSTTVGTYTLNIDGMNAQMIGYSGSTVPRTGNTIQLPSTAGAWKKVYFYLRFTAEFDTAARFFYINSTNVADTMDIRAFDIFETNRPPYSLMDW
jgi:hypothetical protein